MTLTLLPVPAGLVGQHGFLNKKIVNNLPFSKPVNLADTFGKQSKSVRFQGKEQELKVIVDKLLDVENRQKNLTSLLSTAKNIIDNTSSTEEAKNKAKEEWITLQRQVKELQQEYEGLIYEHHITSNKSNTGLTQCSLN